MRIHPFGLAALALVGGCGFSGEFLFPGAIEGVPGILHLTAEDGEAFVPFVIEEGCEAQQQAVDDCTTDCGDENTALSECFVSNAQDNTVYVEIGPTGEADLPGLTLNFEGTGGSVCIFTDPELVYWNQAVGSQGGAAVNRWKFPDNPYDDGDVDLTAGLSVYYTGTEGERLGDFAVQYQDSLGNAVPINLVACSITSSALGFNPVAHSGRGAPEYCTITNTQPGVSYTVALEAFSLPPDDNRLMMGVLLADGGCGALINKAAPADAPGPLEKMNEECLIMGEAIPGIGTISDGVLTLAPEDEPLKGQLFYGYAEAQGRSWPGSEAFEARFCSEEPMRGFCNTEAEEVDTSGRTCNWAEPSTVDERCYCGDIRDTPDGGVQ